jgi:hypothetical protein
MKRCMTMFDIVGDRWMGLPPVSPGFCIELFTSDASSASPRRAGFEFAIGGTACKKDYAVQNSLIYGSPSLSEQLHRLSCVPEG